MDPLDKLIEAIESHDDAQVQELISTFPALVARSYADETALHCAVRACNAFAINVLMEHGANVNVPGTRGETPLHYAVRTNDADVVNLVLRYKPNVLNVDGLGITPLLLAARSGAPTIADQLLNAGVVMDFHSAVALGRSSVVKEILERNPDVIDSVRHKEDLLPDAVYANSAPTVALLLQIPGVIVHGFGLSGEPPLTAAVSSSSADPAIAKMLLRHGADPKFPDRRGRTAIDRAKSVGTSHFLEN